VTALPSTPDMRPTKPKWDEPWVVLVQVAIDGSVLQTHTEGAFSMNN